MGDALVARTFDELARASEALATSRYFPNCSTPQQAFAKVVLGRELGIGPVTAMQEVDVIEGKLSMSAAIQAALIKRARTEDGHRRYRWETVSHTEQECMLRFFEWDEDERCWSVLGESSFRMDEARSIRSGQGTLADKDNWRNYPRNMLWARAMSNGATWYCPDVFAGRVYVPDELGREDPEGEPVVDDEPEHADAASTEQPLEAEIVEESGKPQAAGEPGGGEAGAGAGSPAPANLPKAQELPLDDEDPDARNRTLAAIFATATELKLPHEAVKARAYAKYGVKSMTELSFAQLREIRDALKAKARERKAS